jgi:putative Holliday junction resolvase
MIQGRILAIDYGERRMGLALSDPMRIIASGLRTIIVRSDNDALHQLAPIVKESEVVQIILGMPFDSSGAVGAKAQKVKAFSEKLKQHLNIEVTHWDERLSSVSAKKMLLETELKKKRRNKEKLDELAAVVILRHYLDSVR